MSKKHNAKFCKTCWEYLPIQEHEDHNRFHAESQYKSQKIRIENGQPILVNRDERASLTPIGSLKHRSLLKGTKHSGSLNETVFKTEDLGEIEDSVKTKDIDKNEHLDESEDLNGMQKKCELCGKLFHKNWFYKHMLDVHNAKFCMTCWEYLPIHEHEEHRRFHAESQYKSKKIRIENGQPILINREERASVTPIGNKHALKIYDQFVLLESSISNIFQLCNFAKLLLHLLKVKPLGLTLK